MSDGKQKYRGAVARNPSIAGLAALDTYAHALDFLAQSGRSNRRHPLAKTELPFIDKVEGLKNLYLTMSAVAPAKADSSAEEWNPLSQRPHSGLPPVIVDELGAEVTALKTAIDELTILSHEMMHVALWEPFFTGQWQPRSRRQFRDFSLLAEGFCYFFSDIVVSSAVRVRLPDGEFALDRQTPSNARFHPIRAFHALDIRSHHQILDIYLDGFSGQQTPLWQPRGANAYAGALAAQAYAFYSGSLPLLDELHVALMAFGGLAEFYRRFCAIPALPGFIPEGQVALPAGPDFKTYFVDFYQRGLEHLSRLTPSQTLSIRWRRMLQMRAYYAMQIRWLLRENLVVARDWSAAVRHKLADDVDTYLAGLQTALQSLATSHENSPLATLAKLDAWYAKNVRANLQAHDAWVGQRWFIAPRRAGGRISITGPYPETDRKAKSQLAQSVAFLVEELVPRLAECKTGPSRSRNLALISRVANLGYMGGSGAAPRTRSAMHRLHLEMAKPPCRELWSLPMASFDPANNRYRELAFSYQ